VAVSGHVEKEYIDKALKSGMDMVYTKPIAIKEFGSLLL
jgi:coenzyme F420-reducing hydrogenase delta subunit